MIVVKVKTSVIINESFNFIADFFRKLN